MTALSIAVTGASGLLGSRLCAVLSAKGHKVVALSRGTVPAADLRSGIVWRSCELSDGALVQAVLEEAKPDLVFHPASMTEVDLCEKEPERAFLSNVRATEHVTLATRRLGSALVYVSTDYVFDGEAGPYGEDDVPNPRGVYATTKHIAEQVVRTLAPRWAIARTAIVYGWPQAGRTNFGAWLVTALAKRQPVKLFDDQVVSPSLADNVAEMLTELGERGLTGIYNVCGASVVDRVTFGRALCERFGFDANLITPVHLADVPLASPRPKRSGLKTAKVEGALATKPLQLPAALDRFFAAYRAAPISPEVSR